MIILGLHSAAFTLRSSGPVGPAGISLRNIDDAIRYPCGERLMRASPSGLRLAGALLS